jgi:phosphoribosylaminoimidazolecarboxamide formyltransferase / IMP cyclohydrolase
MLFNSAAEGERMSIRENIHQVIDLIKPEHVLVSVFDKEGLEDLVKGILKVNPDARFYSTGGTGKKITEILGDQSQLNYISVEEFTGAPEMEGGLVKTLHPKIHAGLLAERGNPAHEEYLYRILPESGGMSGVYFDVFVGNLYPFTNVIAKEGTTPETARVNIDIGGPAMTMASAKNWHSIAVLTSPSQYGKFMQSVKDQNGMINLELRFKLASQAMKSIGEYRTAIGDYFVKLDFEKDVKPFLDIR